MKNILVIFFLCFLFLKVNLQEEYLLGASFDDEFKSVISHDKSGILSNYLSINDKLFKKVDLLTYISFIEVNRSDYVLYNVLNDSITRAFSLYKNKKVGFIAFNGEFYKANIDLSKFKEAISKSKEVNYLSKIYTDLEEAKLSKRNFEKSKLIFFEVMPKVKYDYEGSFTVEVSHPLMSSEDSEIIEKYSNILKTKYPNDKFDITVNGGGTEVTFLKIKSSKDFFLKFNLYPILFPFEANTYSTTIFFNK